MIDQPWPDTLSEWTLPPPAAHAGEMEPIRVFETAEAALAFLSLQTDAVKAAPQRLPRRFSSAAPSSGKAAVSAASETPLVGASHRNSPDQLRHA
jgi:hypothetical protein